VFDLDPGEGSEWSFVRESALQLRELLKNEGHDIAWPHSSRRQVRRSEIESRKWLIHMF
jgi:hypothetical protein